MKKSAIVLMLAALLIVSGCGLFRKAPVTLGSPPETSTAIAPSMTLTIEIPKRKYTPGEDINLRLIARNTSDKPIAFVSPTSALYRVRLLRHTPLGWRWINQYPQAAMKIKKTWTLQPGQSVKYNQIIPVGRDWPMDEPLRMVAELVGGPELKCKMVIWAVEKK
jgi:hypothetical protein